MASSLSQPKMSPPSSIGFTGNGKKMNTGHMSTASTIGDVLARRAARDPDATAIVCSGLRPLSFGDLARAHPAVGAQLRAAGIGPASRVGIALQRGPEAALLNVAVCCTATVLPINPNLPPGRPAGGTGADSPRCPGRARRCGLPDWVRARPAMASASSRPRGPSPPLTRSHSNRCRPLRRPTARRAGDGAILGCDLPHVRHDGRVQARAGNARKSDRDGAENGALAEADARRPLRLHHADPLQCRGSRRRFWRPC